VFSRGHLRRYAEFLGLPADPLLAQWTAEQGAHQALPDLSRAPQAPRPLDTQRWGRRLAMLAGAVVIALAAWWILQGADVQAPAASPVAASTAAAPAEIAAVATPIPSAAPVTPPAAVEDGGPVAAEPVPGETPDAVPGAVPGMTPAAAPTETTPTVPATTAAPGAGLAVAFTATERCWAEVVDASGSRRLYMMLEPGVRVTASGTPPLRVLLGRGDVTAVEIGGRAASIPTDAVRNSVARFEIAGSGAMRALPPVPAPTATPATTNPATTNPATTTPATTPPASPAPAPAEPPAATAVPTSGGTP
jgi:cytoskeletal protein RodZ